MTSSTTLLDTAQSLASQWLSFNDHTRLYRLQWAAAQEFIDGAPAGWGQLLLHSWAMREGLGQVGEIQLQALTRQMDLDPQQLLASSFIIWTRLADGSEYPRSGIVTDVRSLGSDGGFARWHITLQPWVGLLALQRRSQVWQEQSVESIIDSVLAHYSALAAPAAAGEEGAAAGSGWSWSSCARARLQQSHQGGLRSYIIQYRETDLAFFERLLAEEHLTWRLQTDAQDPARQHLLILADSSDPQSCPADATSQRHGGIRYHGQGSQQEEDAVQQLHALRQLRTADLASVSWDYRAKHSQRHESQSAQPIGSAQTPRWQQHIHLADWRHSGRADGEHHLRHIQTALDAERKRYACESTVRTLGAGRRFALRQSTLHDWAAAALRQLSEEAGAASQANAAPELLPIEVIHAGLNNLPDQTPEQRRQSLRWLPQWVNASTRDRTAQLGYANQFQALRAQQPWLPLFRKADGQVLPGNAPERPRPGLLRATVTDEQGAGTPGELHLDALGRIRIRFDFQETAQQTNSAADNTSPSSCWVRVLQRIAGAGWGGQFIPRIGQEVLVDFIGADIHRPLVIGSLYNGQGEGAQAPTPGGQEPEQQGDEAPFTTSHDHRSSEQGNRVANGHSPAWHAAAPAAATPGHSGHSNPDAMSGYKSAQYPQAHAGGAYNQLVFDDSKQQLRVQLATSQAASQLNLGHLVHQADNHRGSFRGYGFELRTDAWGALRGAQGVLLSTYASQVQEPAADNSGGIALARQLLQLAQASSDMSQTHQSPGLASERGTQRPAHSEQRESEAAIASHLRSIKGMLSSASVESAQADAESYNTQTAPDASHAPRLPYSASRLVQIASADGLISVAGRSQHFAASEHIVQASAEHLQIASGAHTRIHSGQAIGVLAGILQQGQAAATPPAPAAPSAGSTGQQNVPQPGPLAAQSASGTGLNLIAAQGPFILQAQNGRMHIAAKADVDIRSAANLNWSAAKHIKLKTAGGACITIDGGQIEVKCPGTITIHASQRQFVGPATISQQMNSWEQSKFDDPFVVRNPATGQPIANCWVEIERADGSKLKVKTDAQGKTPVQRSEFVEGITLRVLD